jgi:orotidine-5'-phosphate decarboxylase
MTRKELIHSIRQKESFLCVGLDTDPEKMPKGLTMLDFNKAIIDATRDLCVAYKPNIAFYECLGAEGWRVLEETVKYIGKQHFIIADAKRGDIGNTSDYYAKTFFKQIACDSITVAPYMGRDSVEPFLKYESKWAIVLALTSNAGAEDFELLNNDGKPIYQRVLEKVTSWGTPENTMFVVGATRPQMFQEIRNVVPDHFLLVPGVGAQGGSLAEVCRFGMNQDIGLLINASRSILYASHGNDFESAARKEAQKMQEEMKALMA